MKHPAPGSALWHRLVRQGRRLYRLLAFVGVAAGYTLYTSVRLAFVRGKRPRARAKARHQQRGARLLLRLLGVTVRLDASSDQPIVDDRPALYVCNHLGLLDPFVLAAHLRVALVGKAEIADWGAAGWVARTMGVLFVHRGRSSRVEAFVERAQERLRHGVDILAFPEGTTNADRQVLPFKTGVFRSVACQSGEAVVPLYLYVCSVDGERARGDRRQRVIWAGGTESAGRHAWRLLALREVTMGVRTGAPIATEGRGRKELARRAQHQIEAMARETFDEMERAASREKAR